METTSADTTSTAAPVDRSLIMYSVAGVCLLTTIAFAIATICYVRKYAAGSRRNSHVMQPDVAKSQEAQTPIITSAPDYDDSPVIYDDALNVLSDNNISRNIVNGCFLYAAVVRCPEKTDAEVAKVVEFTVVETQETPHCAFEQIELPIRSAVHDEGFFPTGATTVSHRDTPPTYDDVGPAILSSLC